MNFILFGDGKAVIFIKDDGPDIYLVLTIWSDKGFGEWNWQVIES